MWGPYDSHPPFSLWTSSEGPLFTSSCLVSEARERGCSTDLHSRARSGGKSTHEATGHKLSVCGPEAESSLCNSVVFHLALEGCKWDVPKGEEGKDLPWCLVVFEQVLDQPVGCQPRLSECYLWV